MKTSELTPEIASALTFTVTLNTCAGSASIKELLSKVKGSTEEEESAMRAMAKEMIGDAQGALNDLRDWAYTEEL